MRKPHPWTVGSPSDEIGFLLDFVNGDWSVFGSVALREAFLLTHRIFGRRATNQALQKLEDEARRHLHTIANGKRPTLKNSINEVVDARGRLHRHVDDRDFSGRVRMATRQFLHSRRRVRQCVLCPDFFFPRSSEKACKRCRDGDVLAAFRLEETERRVREHRGRSTKMSDRLRLQVELARLRERLDRAERAGDRVAEETHHRLISVVEDRLAQLERQAPPPPKGATYEVEVQIGGADIPVSLGPAHAQRDRSASSSDPVVRQRFTVNLAKRLEEFRAEHPNTLAVRKRGRL